MRSFIKTKKGFTLIEMLIVVVIIGILAAVILPKMGSSSRTARANACKANISSINTGIELLIFENNVVADTVDIDFPSGNAASLADPPMAGIGAITKALFLVKFPNGGIGCPVAPATHYMLVNGRVDAAAGGNDHTGADHQ